jgi:hypothetical protein
MIMYAKFQWMSIKLHFKILMRLLQDNMLILKSTN